MSAIDDVLADPRGCSLRSDPVIRQAIDELTRLRDAIEKADELAFQARWSGATSPDLDKARADYLDARKQVKLW